MHFFLVVYQTIDLLAPGKESREQESESARERELSRSRCVLTHSLIPAPPPLLLLLHTSIFSDTWEFTLKNPCDNSTFEWKNISSPTPTNGEESSTWHHIAGDPPALQQLTLSQYDNESIVLYGGYMSDAYASASKPNKDTWKYSTKRGWYKDTLKVNPTSRSGHATASVQFKGKAAMVMFGGQGLGQGQYNPNSSSGLSMSRDTCTFYRARRTNNFRPCCTASSRANVRPCNACPRRRALAPGGAFLLTRGVVVPPVPSCPLITPGIYGDDDGITRWHNLSIPSPPTPRFLHAMAPLGGAMQGGIGAEQVLLFGGVDRSSDYIDSKSSSYMDPNTYIFHTTVDTKHCW